MFGFVVFVLSLVILFFLSRIFIQRLFNFLLRLSGSPERASLVLGLIFLPGTFVHEISHFLMALVLLVPVGRVNLAPEILEKGVKLGSVEIGKTDFIRGSLIGLAPLFVGIGILIFSTNYVLANGSFDNWWLIVLLISIIFQLTHTMFSSRSDLRALFELTVFVVIVSIFLLVFKINVPLVFIYERLQDVGPFLWKLSMFLLLPIGIELLIVRLFREA